MGHTADATGRQGMFTPPWHLIPPLVFPGVRVSSMFWICISYGIYKTDLFVILPFQKGDITKDWKNYVSPSKGRHIVFVSFLLLLLTLIILLQPNFVQAVTFKPFNQSKRNFLRVFQRGARNFQNFQDGRRWKFLPVSDLSDQMKIDTEIQWTKLNILMKQYRSRTHLIELTIVLC
jgi:hypothetical protein